jgi:ABC-type lipoprotein release transport system permease subunit
MIKKLAWRNLWRNRRRTFITTTSITFSVMLAIFMQSMQKGTFSNLIRNVVTFHSGYIQIHGKGYWDEQVIENCFYYGDTINRLIREVDGVAGTVPRLESYALVSFGTLTRGCMLMGTLPIREDSLTRLSSRTSSGEYLKDTSEFVMVAQGLARKLRLSVGDTLVLLGQGYQGSMAAGKYRVGGLLAFSAPALNDNMVYLTLSRAQACLGAEGMVTSVALNISDPAKMAGIQEDLTAKIGAAYEVMNWKEMMPEIDNHIRSDAIGFRVFTGVLYLIVAFGIFSTMLMMTAERRYEFGMVLAIGMKRSKLAWILFGETILISVMGTLSGILLSFPVVWYFRQHPIRFSGANARAFESWGFEPVMPTVIDAAIFTEQSLIVLLISCIVGLYPVLHVRFIDPVRDMKK